MTLNPDELSLLGFIREHGPISAEDIAKISYTEVSEVLQCLSKLEEHGLIHLQRNFLGYGEVMVFLKK